MCATSAGWCPFCCVGHHQDDVVLIIKLLRTAPEALHVVVVLLSHLHNIMSPTPFSLSSPHCIEQNLCVPRLLIVSIDLCLWQKGAWVKVG